MAGANTFPHVIEAKDLADLASIHVAELDFGTICWVISANASFTLTGTPNSPPDGVTVIAPDPGAAPGKPGAAWEKGSGGGGGGTEFLEGITLAALAVTHGNDAKSLVYVLDTASFYRWFPADTTPPNGFIVVAAPGGNWHLEGGLVSLSALGNGADDWPRLIGFVNALAGLGAVQLLDSNGSFLCASRVPLVSGAQIIGAPEVEVVSTLPDSGMGAAGFTQSPFFATADVLAGATTLAAGVSPGALSVPVNDNTIVAGDFIRIVRGADIAQCFEVLSKSGGGPYVLALDAPVEFTFNNNDPVNAVAMPTGILIEGQGMSITGTGDRAVELAYADRCIVRDINVTRRAGSFTAIVCSFDIGGRQNRFERVTVDGGGFSAACMALESEVGSTILDCTLHDAANAGSTFGVYLPSAKRCNVVRTRVWSAQTGIWAGFSNAIDETEACMHLRVSCCDVSNCFTDGIDVVGGSDVTIEGTSSRYNAESGISLLLTPAGGAPQVSVSDVDVSDNHVNSTIGGGLYVHGAGSRLAFANVAAHRNVGGSGLFVDGAAAAVLGSSFYCDDSVGGVQVMSANSVVEIDGFKVRRVASTATWIGVFLGGASSVSMYGGTFEIVGGSGTSSVGQPSVAGSKLALDNVATVGAVTFGVFAAFGVANIVIRGQNVDFDSIVAANRWVTDANTLANFGEFTANGVTGVPVTGFFAADQAISISFNTLGGAPGAQPTISSKAANAFTVNATAGDLSKYDWKAA